MLATARRLVLSCRGLGKNWGTLPAASSEHCRLQLSAALAKRFRHSLHRTDESSRTRTSLLAGPCKAACTAADQQHASTAQVRSPAPTSHDNNMFIERQSLLLAHITSFLMQAQVCSLGCPSGMITRGLKPAESV
jgi:hypothetical protein